MGLSGVCAAVLGAPAQVGDMRRPKFRAGVRAGIDGTWLALNRYTVMPHNTEAERARAERIFKNREKRKADAPKAVADYYAAQQSIVDRTRRLREERLAREANATNKGTRP